MRLEVAGLAQRGEGDEISDGGAVETARRQERAEVVEAATEPCLVRIRRSLQHTDRLLHHDRAGGRFARSTSLTNRAPPPTHPLLQMIITCPRRGDEFSPQRAGFADVLNS